MRKSLLAGFLFLPFLSSCITTGSSLRPQEENRPKVFVAFSLRACEARIKQAKREGKDLRKALPDVFGFSGMTRPSGLIFDPVTQDTIIIGEKDGNSALSPDDFVCALRSLYCYGTYPQLTIDPDGGKPSARWHLVKMTKGIENSRFGRVFFDSDYLLKKISLNLAKTRVPRFKTQYGLAAEKRSKDAVHTRFWFKPAGVDILASKNAVFISSYPVEVSCETLYPKYAKDEASVIFARTFSERFDEFARGFSVFEDLRNMFRWVGIAASICYMEYSPDLNFWLTDYAIEKVEIPSRIKGLSNIYADLRAVLTVCGGVDSAFLNLRLKAREALALDELSDMVIKRRPSKDALSWEFALGEIKLPVPARSKEGPEIEKLLAESLLSISRKEYEKALANFDRIIETGPDFSFALQMKAGLLADLGRFEEAVSCYDGILKTKPQDIRALVNKSEALLNTGLYQEAFLCAQEALKISPGDYRAWYNKAEALKDLGRTREAIKAYEKFIKFAPSGDCDIEKARKQKEGIL